MCFDGLLMNKGKREKLATHEYIEKNHDTKCFHVEVLLV